MKMVHFHTQGSDGWGALTEPTRITPFDPSLPFDEILSFRSDPERLFGKSLPNSIDVGHIRWLPPATLASKVICIGKNFADHARELGGETPELPIVFSKFSSVLIGHRETIVLPPISQQVDFEAELVVVLGRGGRDIPREQAAEFIAGYCCGNDISARDWQKGRPGGQWLLGKSFDTFGPLGPFLVTADEIPDPHQLELTLKLNGQVMQHANTNLLIYRIDYLIAYLSQFFTLQPGDLIFTGTPAGVGAGRTPPVFLKPGDELEVEIERVGKLRNFVAGGDGRRQIESH